MSHEIAKLILEQSTTLLERQEAIKVALSVGMPLNEIEEYLDWLELVRRNQDKSASQDSSSSTNSESHS